MTKSNTLPRRSFLSECFSVAACGMATAGGAFGFLLGRRAHTLRNLAIDDFRDSLGSTFSIETDEGHRLAASLSEVSPSRFAPGPVGRQQPFSVIFEIQANTRLPQEVYTVKHGRLGTHRYLLVPVDGASKNNYMEVVFG